MVETDRGDDRDQRPTDVGRIEPSAEPDFQYGQIDGLSFEVKQRERRDDFKIGRPIVGKFPVDPLDRRTNGFAQSDQFGFVGHRAVDSPAFFDPLEMG